MWSPAIKSSEHGLEFKVWLDLVDLPPHIWSLDELAVVLASFGLILAHSPLNKVPSFERLHLVIATDNLSLIPHNIQLFLHYRISTVPIIEVSILRFDTIHTVEDTNQYFVSVEKRIGRIVAESLPYRDSNRIARYNIFTIHHFFMSHERPGTMELTRNVFDLET
jgi:hypothetical protein